MHLGIFALELRSHPHYAFWELSTGLILIVHLQSHPHCAFWELPTGMAMRPGGLGARVYAKSSLGPPSLDAPPGGSRIFSCISADECMDTCLTSMCYNANNTWPQLYRYKRLCYCFLFFTLFCGLQFMKTC